MIIISALIFLVTSASLPETIPPLPIEELKKVELHYNDTLLKSLPVDTLYLRLYGWNQIGGNILFSNTIKKRTLFNLDVKGEKNKDYSNYIFSKGDIDIGWITGNFWQELGASAFLKKRTQEYYQQIGVSYNPIWFISSATLMLDNTIRGAQYFNRTRENFVNGKSELSYNAPSPLGIINADINTLLQNYNNNGPTTLTSTSVGLSDLITIGDNLYLEPGAKYNIEKKRLSIKGDIGFFIKGITTNIDIENNNVNTLYFDTLYSNAFPITVNRDLDYPLCKWNIGLSIQRKNLDFSARYRQFSSLIYWFPMVDPIIPGYDNQNCKNISTTIKVTWSPIINTMTMTYAPDKRNLIPLYTIADSLQINLRSFTFGADCFVNGPRRWETLIETYTTQPYYITYSSSIAYKWRYLRLFVNIDNILDNRYEILPFRFSLGRKYYIGLEIIPEHKK
jgi:hypothetical protein